jgi:hypothetical protein
MQENISTDKLLVGTKAIADELGQPVRRVTHWIQAGRIKSARKLGDLWTAPRAAIRAEFGLS